jgi:hypothetical protein
MTSIKTEHLLITKPNTDEYPAWAAAEIGLVDHTDLECAFRETLDHSLELLSGLDEEKLNYRYAEDKWTIREIWQHLIDTERVLSYRAMRYSRGDKTVLTGFNAENYTQAIRVASRPWREMIEEYRVLRQSTIQLFRSFSDEMLLQRGTAGKTEMTVRAVGFLIAGHDAHHLNTIRKKYLSAT